MTASRRASSCRSSAPWLAGTGNGIACPSATWVKVPSRCASRWPSGCRDRGRPGPQAAWLCSAGVQVRPRDAASSATRVRARARAAPVSPDAATTRSSALCMPWTARSSPSTASGWSRKYSLTGSWTPSSSAIRVCSQPVRSGSRPGSRRRKISRSVTTPGARRALVCAAGQADRAGQVGQGGDLAAGGGVAGVHGVAGGHHGDQAAGADQVQGLDDEVVVDAVAAGVVQAVGQGERAERDVADRQVEAAFGARNPAKDSLAMSASG